MQWYQIEYNIQYMMTMEYNHSNDYHNINFHISTMEMRCASAPRVMRAADGGGYVSIQESVWHRLADTVYCVVRKRLEL